MSCAPGDGQELVCTARGLPVGALALLALPYRSFLPLLIR